jgi:hypothetical protein
MDVVELFEALGVASARSSRFCIGSRPLRATTSRGTVCFSSA